MELPGHHVCGGRGPAWAVPASAKPARPKPPDTNTAVVNPTIPRLSLWVVFMLFPLLIAISQDLLFCARRGVTSGYLPYFSPLQVDTAGAATDPNIGLGRIICPMLTGHGQLGTEGPCAVILISTKHLRAQAVNAGSTVLATDYALRRMRAMTVQSCDTAEMEQR